jgi:hypothetical protein
MAAILHFLRYYLFFIWTYFKLELIYINYKQYKLDKLNNKYHKNLLKLKEVISNKIYTS